MGCLTVSQTVSRIGEMRGPFTSFAYRGVRRALPSCDDDHADRSRTCPATGRQPRRAWTVAGSWFHPRRPGFYRRYATPAANNYLPDPRCRLLRQILPRLEGWLLGHRRFQPTLRVWRTEGAIPRGSKHGGMLGHGPGLSSVLVEPAALPRGRAVRGANPVRLCRLFREPARTQESRSPKLRP